MIPVTQLIRTPRWAFQLTLAGAYVAVVWMNISWLVGVRELPEALSMLGQMLVGGPFMALIGAAAGGFAALLFGWPLSRQYCWLLGTVAGMVMLPCISNFLLRTMLTYPAAYNWSDIAFGRTVRLAMLGLTVGGGIATGVLMTRHRLGLAARSRRGAIWGMIFGVVALGLLEIFWLVLKRLPQPTSNVIVSGDGYPREWLTPVLFTLSIGAISAILRAERYEAPRFAVLMTGKEHARARDHAR